MTLQNKFLTPQMPKQSNSSVNLYERLQHSLHRHETMSHDYVSDVLKKIYAFDLI